MQTITRSNKRFRLVATCFSPKFACSLLTLAQVTQSYDSLSSNSRLTRNRTEIERERESWSMWKVDSVSIVSLWRCGRGDRERGKKRGRAISMAAEVIPRLRECFPAVERSIESIFESQSHPEISVPCFHPSAYPMTRLHRRRLYRQCLHPSGGPFDFPPANLSTTPLIAPVSNIRGKK